MVLRMAWSTQASTVNGGAEKGRPSRPILQEHFANATRDVLRDPDEDNTTHRQRTHRTVVASATVQ